MKRVLLFILLPVVLMGGMHGEEASAEAKRKKVLVHMVKPVDMRQEVTLIGMVKAQSKAKVLATGSGIVEEVHIGDGERIEQGAKVVTLRNAELQQEYELARANEGLKEVDYKRSKRLFEKDIMSAFELEKVEQAYNEARAKTQQALKKVRDTVIEAPIGGITGSVEPSRGERVDAGDEIVTIYDDAGLKVGFDVPDWMLGKIEKGDTVVVNGGAGEIYYVERVISPKTHMGKASARLEATGIPIGKTVEVTVITDDVKGALAVPVHSIFMQEDEPHVYVVNDKGKLQPKQVKLGIMSNDLVQVMEGLEEGEAVVKYITSNLYYGLSVEIASEEE